MQDQYLKAIDFFDSESSRFWTRFNLFTGIQLIVVAGIAANITDLREQESFGCLFIIAAFVFSLFTILVTWRSHQIQMGIFRSLVKLEEADSSLILLKTYIKHSNSRMGTISRYCIVMSVTLSLFWIVLLLAFINVF